MHFLVVPVPRERNINTGRRETESNTRYSFEGGLSNGNTGITETARRG